MTHCVNQLDKRNRRAVQTMLRHHKCNIKTSLNIYEITPQRTFSSPFSVLICRVDAICRRRAQHLLDFHIRCCSVCFGDLFIKLLNKLCLRTNNIVKKILWQSFLQICFGIHGEYIIFWASCDLT